MNVLSALREIFKKKPPCSTETVYLKDALGRTLSKPIVTKKNIPEFDTSSMDGFAVKKSSLGKIKRFKILGEVPAGAITNFAIKPSECVRVYTGSRMPKNADFVIIQENTQTKEGFMLVKDFDKKNPYVRKAGLDFRKGQIISHQ